MRLVHVEDYIRPEDGENRSPAAARALAENPGDDISFVFGKGVWHFYEEGASLEECWESNNDGGRKRVICALRGRRNIRLDGGGGEWVLHGRVSPVVIAECGDVTVCRLTGDCVRPFYTQGTILRATQEEVELAIDREGFPFTVRGGNFVPYADAWENDLSGLTVLCQEFSPETGGPVPGGHTALAKIGQGHQNLENLPAMLWVLRASLTPEGHLLLKGDFSYVMTPGNVLVMTHERRTNSFVFVQDSRAVKLEDITIHHIGSMGVIAQNSRDITLERVRILPREGSGRLISTNADATHFVQCSGRLTLRDCVFESMMDDGTNIHGIYTVVREAGGTQLTLELRHFQQRGVLFYRPGDRLTVLDPQTLETRCRPVVAQAALADGGRLVRIRLEQASQEPLRPGDVVENPDNMPEVLIEGCRTGKNRPRGFLLGTPKRAVIRGNTFYNSCCGIQIAGDSRYWFESGPVHDVEIRENIFDGCCYLDGGYAVVIAPERMPDAAGFFHHHVRILDNRFDLPDGRLVYARSVDGLTVLGNSSSHGGQVFAQDCSHVHVQSVFSVD